MIFPVLAYLKVIIILQIAGEFYEGIPKCLKKNPTPSNVGLLNVGWRGLPIDQIGRFIAIFYSSYLHGSNFYANFCFKRKMGVFL